jgi:MYXO-CTERM domain-containing protein
MPSPSWNITTESFGALTDRVVAAVVDADALDALRQKRDGSCRRSDVRLVSHAIRLAATLALLFFSLPAEAYGYVFSTFTGDDAAGMKLSIYTSSDALHFTLLSDTGFGGPSGYLRDPSIMKHIDGKYYVAYTDPLTDDCCGEENHFSIASSADLVHWTNLTMVNAGVPGVAHTWAPEWFIEGSTVHVIANIDTTNTDSNFKPYLYTAEDATLTSWTAPTPLGFGPNYIDTFVLKVGATYHAFAKNETTRYCEHATASALTGPWTFVGTGNWAGWGSGMEGPAVVQLDDGTWRIFMDGQGSTPFVTATSPDLYQWSAWTALPDVGNLVRHGTVIRDTPTGGTPDDGGLVPEGAADEDSGSGDAAADGGDGRAASPDDGAVESGPGPASDAGTDGTSADTGGAVAPADGSNSEGGAISENGATPTGSAGCSCRAGGTRAPLPCSSESLAVLAVLGGAHLRRRKRGASAYPGRMARPRS